MTLLALPLLLPSLGLSLFGGRAPRDTTPPTPPAGTRRVAITARPVGATGAASIDDAILRTAQRRPSDALQEAMSDKKRGALGPAASRPDPWLRQPVATSTKELYRSWASDDAPANKPKCPVVRLRVVLPHPRNNDMSVAITEAGDVATIPRGSAIRGDLAVFLPAGTLLHEGLLKQLGHWDDASGYGTLRGIERNRVPSRKVRGVVVHGMLLTGRQFRSGWDDTNSVRITLRDRGGRQIGEANYQAGDCAAQFLGAGNADTPIAVFPT